MRLRLDRGELDLDARCLRTAEGGEVAVSPMEARLLAHLAARDGEVVSQDELLREVWGYGPAVETRTVRTTINRLRAKLERDPARPVHLVTEHGFGYRLRAERIPDRPAAPPARTPALLAATFGRDAELARLREALALPGLVTIVGPGGVGKSHLARRVAAELGGRWIDAQGLDAAGLASAVARAAGRAGADARAVARRVVAEEPDVAWVLDDLEPSAIELLDALVEAAPALRVLATARGRLGVAGERVLPLGPLLPDDAVALVIARATARDLALELSPADPALRQLVARLDGLPLALEIAAAQLDLLPPAALVERLAGGLAALPEGERAVARMLDHAWAALDPTDRAALASCAVLAGPVPLALAEGVIGGADPLGATRRLVDRALLARPAPGVVRMLVVLKEAVVAREPAALAAARARHRAALLAAADRPIAALDTLRAELLAAHASALAEAPEAAPPLARALDRLLAAQGPAEVHLAVLRATAPLDPGWARLATVRALRLAGRLDEALAEIAQAPEDPELATEHARIRMLRGQVDVLEQVLDGLPADRAADPDMIRMRAKAARLRGQLARAEALVREALAVDRSGSAERRVAALCDLGEIREERGALEEGAAILREAAELARAAGLSRMLAVARNRLVSIRMAQGRTDEAMDEARGALAAFVASGDLRAEAALRHRLVQLAVQVRDPGVEACIAEARRAEQGAASDAVRGWIDVNEGLHHLDHGEVALAAACLARGLGRVPAGIDRAAALAISAWAPLVSGDRIAAEARLGEVLAGEIPERLRAEVLVLLALAAVGTSTCAERLAEARACLGGDAELRVLVEIVEAADRDGPLPSELPDRVGRSVAVRLALRALRRPMALRARGR